MGIKILSRKSPEKKIFFLLQKETLIFLSLEYPQVI
jgi:hypothetical protein